MARVQGIGGAFIYSPDASRLASWYQENLGLSLEAHPDGIGYFCVFYTRDYETGQVRENPVFAINQSDQSEAHSGGFMLNLRVDDLDAFLFELEKKGVSIEEKRLDWERGRHAWIKDGDGNRVELYQELIPEA